jgi:hypothetical protein
MASNLSVSLAPEAVRSVLGATIAAGAGAYVNVGTVLAQPARLILFQNGTDGDVMVSFDGGITDHMPIFLGAFVLLDVTTNRTDTGGAFNISQGSQFAVRTLGGTFTTPTTRAFFLTSFYAK